MIWVPFATKFGKRTSLLISMALLFAVLIWTAKAQSYTSLFAARCLSGFASAAGEVCAIIDILCCLSWSLTIFQEYRAGDRLRCLLPTRESCYDVYVSVAISSNLATC